MTAFDDVRKVYEVLGEKDPFWAILSNRRYRRDVVDEAEFFASGEANIARQFGLIDASRAPLERGRALDFGCGLGRLTNALASRFDEVVGVDVSSTMIAGANRLRKHDNCSFTCNPAEDLSIFPDRHFNFVYSDITLQHIPMPAAGNYLQEFVRILKPDGIAICMIPDCKDRNDDSLVAKLDRFRREKARPFFKKMRGKYPVQIHAIARGRVERLVEQAGGEVFETEVPPGFRHKRFSRKPYFYWIRSQNIAHVKAA